MMIPEKLTQGTTRTWKDGVLYDDFNSPLTSADYTLTYVIRGNVAVNGSYGCDIVAEADGEGWKTTLQTSDSVNLVGLYNWNAFVQKGDDATTKYKVGEGQVFVEEDISAIDPATAGYDGRTQFEKIVAQCDVAALACMNAMAAGNPVIKYSIGTRMFERQANDSTLNAIKDQRSYYANLLAKERIKNAILNGEGDPRTITVRFRSPH